MFNTQHILYMVISGVLTALLLLFFRRHIQSEQGRIRVLKFFALITVLIHVSDALYYFLTTSGQYYVSCTHILPVYPCNIVMWMLLIAAYMENKKGLLFRLLSEFCFYGGIICSVLGIALNVNYDLNPTLADYGVLKGLLSHSTMLVGCIYMLVGKFIRIRPFNALSFAWGLAVFVACGMFTNWLFEHFGMVAPDGMFLRSNPYLPFSPIIPGILAIIVLWVVLLLVERHKKKKK